MNRKPLTEEQYKRNLLVLDRILVRASGPHFWGKITLTFENGKLRDHFEIRSFLKGNGKSNDEIDDLLDDAMGDLSIDTDS
jgi:hypothetical protein